MDTQALQALVAHGGAVRLPRLTFRVDKPIRVLSGTVIEGNGAVIEACHDGYAFLISRAYDACIRDLDIRGTWNGDDSASLGAGIQIQESRSVSMENVRISNMPGRGIVAASHVAGLSIRGCYIDACAISIFLFKGVTYGRIEGCGIHNSRILGIFVDDGTEGDTQATAIPNEHTIITGNMIVLGGTSPRNMGVGIGVSGSTDTIIANNIVRNFGSPGRDGHGIVLNNGQGGFHQGKRTVVTGNILSDHTGYGLYAMGQQDFVESGNVYANNGLGDCKFVQQGSVA